MTFMRVTPGVIFLLLMSAICFSQDSSSIASIEDSGIKVSASVDIKEVPLNRNLTLTIQVSWSGGLDRYEIDEFENPIVRNLEIVGTSSANRVTGGEIPTTVKEYQFILKPIELGMAYIESTVITYNDRVLDQNQRLLTNRLDAKVIDPVPEPGESKFTLMVFIIGIIVLGGGIAAFIVIQKKRTDRQAQLEEEVVLPLEERFLQELKETVDLSSIEIDVGQSFSSLSRIYRKFLAEKFGMRALEATTEDVVSSICETVNDERFVNSTKEIFDMCDLAKFAGGEGSKSDLERVYTLVESNLERSLRGELSNRPEENSQSEEEQVD